MTFGKESLVFGLLCLLGIQSSVFERSEVTAALETDWSDQALDLGTAKGAGQLVALVTSTIGRELLEDLRFSVWFGALLLLAGYLSANDEFSNVVFLLEVEELSDLGGSLGSKAFRKDIVRKTGDFLFTLFDNDKGEDSHVGSNDTPSHRLAFPLSGTTCSIARVPIRE
jgi:hypothetical protein